MAGAAAALGGLGRCVDLARRRPTSGFPGLGQQAVVAAEFMGVEAVHRATRAPVGRQARQRTARSSGPTTAEDARRGPEPGLIDAVVRAPGVCAGSSGRCHGVAGAASRGDALQREAAAGSRGARGSWPRNCAASAP